MSVFYIVIGLISLVYFASSKDKCKQKRWYISLCAIMVFLSCVRDENVGADSYTYTEYFSIYSSHTFADNMKWKMEPGYVILNMLIGYISKNVRFFLVAINFIVLIPPMIFIWKRSTAPILSLLIFVVMGNWFSTMGIFRQWCATAILIYGYDCIVKRKLIPFLLSVAFACMFHKTALFYIPLYFLYNHRVSTMTLIASMLFSIGTWLFRNVIVALMNLYVSNELTVHTGQGYTYMVVLWVIIIAFHIFAKHVENEKYTKLNYLAIIYSASIQPLALVYGTISRIHIYCWFGLSLTIPSFLETAIDQHDDKNYYLAKLVAIMVLLLWFLVANEIAHYEFMKI